MSEVMDSFIKLKQFVSILKDTLRNADKDKWIKWKGNCCRQTGILGSRFLKDEGITCKAVDCVMVDKGKTTMYDHVVIFAFKNNVCYMLDYPRPEDSEMTITSKSCSKEEYDSIIDTQMFREYAHDGKTSIILGGETKPETGYEVDIGEYYTGKTPNELYKLILQKMTDKGF